MNTSRAPVIAVVAPSGYVADSAVVVTGLERLRDAGCEVRCALQECDRFQRFGASDAVRAAQLHAAAADPDVDIVLALRGGYGLSRLLPLLDVPMLAVSGKLFVGHSDFTALHMALLAHGAASFAGPMLSPDFCGTEVCASTHDNFWRCLRGPVHSLHFESTPHRALDVAGTLWGGNLTMLAHLAGTPWMPRIEGGILFLEDINEHPYRIERTLLQLHHAGLLNQRAIVLGDFSGYRLTEYDNGYDFETMLDFLRERLDVPVVTGLPFGHIADKATLVVGSHARLVSDGNACTLEMSAYPTLA